MIQQALLWAAAGTGFTFLMTTIGAAMVFFMKRQSSALMQQIFLGFASGVMIAASIWSLLIPAIDEAAQNGQPGWIPAAGGFILGLVLMLVLDGLMPHLHSGAEQAEGLPSSFRRTTLLVLAVTLHNIPEGMAVGLSFARAAQHTGQNERRHAEHGNNQRPRFSRQRAQILCERYAVRLPRRQYRRHAEHPHKECAHGHVQQQHDAAEKLQTLYHTIPSYCQPSMS